MSADTRDWLTVAEGWAKVGAEAFARAAECYGRCEDIRDRLQAKNALKAAMLANERRASFRLERTILERLERERE